MQHLLIISRILDAALQHMQHPTGTALKLHSIFFRFKKFASQKVIIKGAFVLSLIVTVAIVVAITINDEQSKPQ